MDRILTLIQNAKIIWDHLLEFLDIPGDVWMALMTAAITWHIYRGHPISGEAAACYTAALTGLVAWKIKK